MIDMIHESTVRNDEAIGDRDLLVIAFESSLVRSQSNSVVHIPL